MSLPKLSHLQSLIVESIGSQKISGRELRLKLAKEHRERKTGPAFYQMMSRLEDGGLVEGEYTQKIVDGQIIKERLYRVTASGEKALRSTLKFYESFRGLHGPSYA
jgi:DNA-binding PadR family transcriptional regulator